MNNGTSKIIRSFQNRLEIDTAVRSLGNTSTDAELQQLASEIAGRYGEQAVPALLALLDTGVPQLRGGLGHLAAALPPEDVVPALRAAARNRGLSDQARLTAITILEGFLGIEPEQAMYDGMASPEELALLSLQELLLETRANPMVVVEYLDQLSHEPVDVQLTMVRSAQRLEEADRLQLLRMFAQDPDGAVSREALQALASAASAEAGEVLLALLPNLSSELSPTAERALQKLRLRGVRLDREAPPPEGRCLASPPDSQDSQLLWFALPNPDGNTSQLLQMVITQRTGVTQASGSLAAASASLPPPAPVGTVHRSDRDAGLRGSLVLEAPFDYGRRRVLAALAANQRTGSPTPLHYRLLNPLLWHWHQPAPAQPLAAAPQATPSGPGSLAEHPALASWFLLTDEIFQMAESLMLSSDEVTPAQVEQATLALARDTARDTAAMAALSQSLQSLQEWLALAGDQSAAGEAAAIAADLAQSPSAAGIAATEALLAHLCLQGLRTAMVNLALGLKLVS